MFFLERFKENLTTYRQKAGILKGKFA